MSTSTPGRAPIDPFAGLKRATEKAKAIAPAATVTDMTADDLRSKIVALYEQSKPALSAFYQYSQSAAALAEEYHFARFREVYPASLIEQLTLACTLDARETPATLDTKLAELSSVQIKKIIYDRAKATYYLYV